jgi:hypothetical protein
MGKLKQLNNSLEKSNKLKDNELNIMKIRFEQMQKDEENAKNNKNKEIEKKIKELNEKESYLKIMKEKYTSLENISKELEKNISILKKQKENHILRAII